MASAYMDRITSALSSLGKRKASGDSDGSPGSAPSSKRIVFRPWDQKDMHRRLETYRPLTWFAKPDIVNPVACASRGWYNSGRDELCCEFCHLKLLYPQNTPLEARDRAAALFAEQLSCRHDTHCPWRHTKCDDSVLAFKPSTTPAASTSPLQDGYRDRLAKLERVELLPEVYERAVQQLAAQANSSLMNTGADQQQRAAGWGAQCLRKVLALPPPRASPDAGTIPPAFDPSTPVVLPSKLTMAQKARLLALLGWEAEELPAGSSGRPSHLCAYRPSREAYTLAHLLGRPSKPGDDEEQAQAGGKASDKARWSMDNVVLNCPSCKSRVGLWNFIPQDTLILPSPPSPTTHPRSRSKTSQTYPTSPQAPPHPH